MTAPNTACRIVLRSHDWRFARAEAVLSANPGRPFGYRYSLKLPADCLRVRELCGSDGDWRQQGNELLTDQIGAWLIRYTADVTDLPPHVQAAVDTRDRAEQANAKAVDNPEDAKAQIAARAAWGAYKDALADAKIGRAHV